MDSTPKSQVAKSKWWNRRLSIVEYIAAIIVVVLLALMFKDKILNAMNSKGDAPLHYDNINHEGGLNR